MIVAQINPITVIGLVETSNVPPGGWLLQTAAGSVSDRLVSTSMHADACFCNSARMPDQRNKGLACLRLHGS